MIDWYITEHAQTVEDKKVDGSFAKTLAKTVAEFNKLGALAYKYHDLHCFGFVMNLQPDHLGLTHSGMWGSTPAFEEMEKSQKAIISKRTLEWESLLRVAELQRKGSEEGSVRRTDDAQLWIVTTPLRDLDRDGQRKVFVSWLAKDIGRILYTHELATLTEAQKVNMPWAKWLNFALNHKLCLVNWPLSTQSPDGTVEKYDYRNYVKHEDLKISNERRHTKPDHHRAVRIIRWAPVSTDDLKLSQTDKAYWMVPLLIEYPEYMSSGVYAEPVVLARVRDAPKLRFFLNNGWINDDDDGDDDDNNLRRGMDNDEEDEEEEEEEVVVVKKVKKTSGKRAASPVDK
ncbi:hypothetical protein H0H93_013339, partial [Arthromyces matolae]